MHGHLLGIGMPVRQEGRTASPINVCDLLSFLTFLNFLKPYYRADPEDVLSLSMPFIEAHMEPDLCVYDTFLKLIYISSPDHTSELHIYISTCLLVTSMWNNDRHLKLNMSKTNFCFLFPSSDVHPSFFSISVNVPFIPLNTQKSWVILTCLSLSPF